MEHLHSAWGFLFILGLFAVELGCNTIRSRRLKQTEPEMESQPPAIRPYALHRQARRTRTV